MKTFFFLTSVGVSDNLLGVLLYIIAIAVIIVLAYFTTRFVAKAYSFGTKSKYMKLLDRIILSPDRSIVLVELANKVYLIGSDKNGVNLLDTFDLETIKGFEAEQNPLTDKKSFLDFFNGKGKL